MKHLTLSVFLLLAGCSAAEYGIEVAKEVNDTAMDKAYNVICGNTLRAQQELQVSRKIDEKAFKDFCGIR